MLLLWQKRPIVFGFAVFQYSKDGKSLVSQGQFFSAQIANVILAMANIPLPNLLLLFASEPFSVVL
jgi:hypothetical protein